MNLKYGKESLEPLDFLNYIRELLLGLFAGADQEIPKFSGESGLSFLDRIDDLPRMQGMEIEQICAKDIKNIIPDKSVSGAMDVIEYILILRQQLFSIKGRKGDGNRKPPPSINSLKYYFLKNEVSRELASQTGQFFSKIRNLDRIKSFTDEFAIFFHSFFVKLNLSDIHDNKKNEIIKVFFHDLMLNMQSIEDISLHLPQCAATVDDLAKLSTCLRIWIKPNENHSKEYYSAIINPILEHFSANKSRISGLAANSAKDYLQTIKRLRKILLKELLEKKSILRGIEVKRIDIVVLPPRSLEECCFLVYVNRDKKLPLGKFVFGNKEAETVEDDIPTTYLPLDKRMLALN